jgi:predicted SnoaL-like aldol condensation-catalyzing enzyme
MTKIIQTGGNATTGQRIVEHKQIARQFLELVAAGKIDEAYAEYVSAKGRHHNPFFREGFPALKEAMKENRLQFPDKQMTIKHVIAEGDMVAIHSHIVPRAGETGIAAIHLFRFQEDKIEELWDIDQPIPADSPNRDGVF